MTWTQFSDMHSGGGTKEGNFEYIHIEAPEDEARVIFYNRFGHSADRVSCTCCGEDYSTYQFPTLADASHYERNCAYVYFYLDNDEEVGELQRPELKGGMENGEYVFRYEGRAVVGRYVDRPKLAQMKHGLSEQECIDRYISLDDWLASEEVLVVRAEEIPDWQRRGTVPEQGFVWQD